jgi:16S rRNA (guanine527-N7)-methyltransferase
MVTHHLLDSLAVIAPLLRQLAGTRDGPAGSAPVRLLDVGSGAGLPGVVIAICCPEIEVTCVDTVAKKAAFIQQVAATLRLPNLRGLHARVENLSGPFDVICSRAFASLADFVNWSRAALGARGVLAGHEGPAPGRRNRGAAKGHIGVSRGTTAGARSPCRALRDLDARGAGHRPPVT